MIEKLKAIAGFKVFSEEFLNKLGSIVKIEEYNKGDVIFNEGSEGESTYFIDSGEVEITKQNKTLSLFTKGQTFGEMSLFDTEKRSADAVCRTNARLIKINNDDFRELLNSYPVEGCKFLFTSIREMARRLRNTSDYFITVFETGKIVGGDYTLSEMAQKIIERLLSDIKEASGCMLLVYNKFTELYDIAGEKGVSLLTPEKAVNLIKNSKEKNIKLVDREGIVLGVPVEEEENILGYIFLEKTQSSESFSSEQEIIISAVANQVGLGLLKAYSKQEEEARKRLERNRMKGY